MLFLDAHKPLNSKGVQSVKIMSKAVFYRVAVVVAAADVRAACCEESRGRSGKLVLQLYKRRFCEKRVCECERKGGV